MNGHITKWLAAYHDGELRGRRLAQVEKHLVVCPDCQAELYQLQSLSSLLSQAPEAPALTSPDRFAAQVGLRLTRKPQDKLIRSKRPAWLWIAIPITLMTGLGFLKVVQLVSGSLSIAQMFGYGDAAVSQLTGVQPQASGLVTRLSAALIDLGIPFSPQILIGLVLPGILAVAYLLWLIFWGLNQQEYELSKS